MPTIDINLTLCFLVLILFHERVFSDKAILDHIKFSYECFDRVITNCTVQELQYEAGLGRYLFGGYGEVSREAVKARTARIHEQVEQLAKSKNIEIIELDIGNSLLEPATKALQKFQPIPDDEDRIVAIFKQLDFAKCWNWHSEEKILRRKKRRVYHYTVYHFDRDFGLGSHKLNTYLPNNVRGYFNQHNWLVQKLKQQNLFNDDIGMYYNSFQDLGRIDPDWFQALCDSLSYRDVFHYDRKWIRNLWPELENLDYRSYIDEAELCSNIVFKQKSFLNNFYHNQTISAYDLAHPDKLSFVFKRRIDRRYRNEFKTKLSIVETKPCLKVNYKRQQYKEYLKQLALRCESTVNNAKDLDLKKQDLEGIRDTCRGINDRALSIQQPVDPNWIRQDLDHNPFKRTIVGEKWIPGLKIDDEKMASVMKGLHKNNVLGVTTRELTVFVNQDQGRSLEDEVTLAQIGYAVRKLRGHGLAVKVDGKNLYRLTPAGHGFVRMFLLITEKVILPFTKNVFRCAQEPRTFRKEYLSAKSEEDHFSKLNRVYTSIEKNITELLDIHNIVINNNPDVSA
jgi:hypothetical protein